MSGRAVINAYFARGCALNYLKIGESRQSSGGYAYPGILDANGYPVSSPGTSFFTQVRLQRDISGYTGAWVLAWTGQLGAYVIGTSSGDGLTVTVGGSFVSLGAFNSTFSGNNGRVVFSFNGNDTQFNGSFAAGTYDGTLQNLYLCREGEEASYLAGNQIRTEYSDILAYLDPLVIRDPPINTNDSNLTRWGYRPTPDKFTWASKHWQPSAWVGTIAGTDTYTCDAATDTPGSWTDGEIIQGSFTNANTSTTPTLDCGSRGAKTIIFDDGVALSIGSIAANSLKTFVYDSLIDKLLLARGDGIYSGPPISTKVQLANFLNKPWWFQVPLMADDAYMLAMANYLYTNMNQWFGLEFSNEVWNTSSGFGHTSIASLRGQALGFDAANLRRIHGYYSKRFCEMVDIFKTVFGSDTRLRPTLGVHMAGSVSLYNTYRFQGADLGAYGFDTSPNRPIDKASYVSPASYLSGAQISNFDANWNNAMTEALAAADDYDSGDPELMAAALLWVDGDIRDGTRNGSAGTQTVAAIATKADAWNTQVATYTGKGLLEYEGSIEIGPPSTSRLTALSLDTGYAAKFSTLIEGWKNSHFAKKLVMDRMQGFMALSHAVAPAAYEDVNDNQWALRRTLYATAYKTEEGFSKFSQGYLNLRLGALV